MLTIVQLQMYFQKLQCAFTLYLVPTEPRGLTVMHLNSTSLEVTWEHPLCDYGIRRGYTVSWQTKQDTDNNNAAYASTPGHT